jgi:RNA polymerase sigma-70 factor, ECF subfamily
MATLVAEPMPVTESWVEELQEDGPRRDAAVERLHDLLLGAARKEVWRRAASQPALRSEALDDIARQSADDALVAVLAKLHTFRGLSRFSTWAYKFAVLETAVAMRRRAWQGREIVLDAEGWSLLADRGSSPARDAETSELLTHITAAIRDELTAHQREVLLALAVDGVPIDVLADRLDTTRGALYKALHDARRKLRATLGSDGLLAAHEEQT